MDEFWSFVQNKSNQRWTWYAIERKSGCILAWHNGRRTDKDFLVLWNYRQVEQRTPVLSRSFLKCSRQSSSLLKWVLKLKIFIGIFSAKIRIIF